MQDFLLELGFEELPARFVEGAVQQLSGKIQKRLKEERLDHGEVLHFSTPRRLALIIKDLKLEQPDLVEEIKGPPENIAYDKEGNLTKAGQGFLRSQGVDAADISIKQFQGSNYLFIKKEIQGQKTAVVLKSILENTINSLSFPKNMRWGNYELRYARPLRWIISLLGTELIPIRVGPIISGQTTCGHRQLSPGLIMIKQPGDYLNNLKNNYVLADVGERRRIIEEQILELANRHGAQVQNDSRLLEEIVNLVEYPTAFYGSFSAEYLEVPAEVLITSMKEHQRYFPVQDQGGNLLPKFIGVRNGADNHLETVIRGNEKVLEARLADAKFFYDEDQKVSLDDNSDKLQRVVFQDGLGSMENKVQRIERLSVLLTKKLNYKEREKSVLRTAHLAKMDLVSQMVHEFPELQGVMGSKYALLQGEELAVATGIREHYQPRFSGDSLPSTVEGILVSLADKVDTLVGYFALGRIPTGSQDPFALRRQAQGVVQLLLHNGFDLSLQALIELAATGYEEITLSKKNLLALIEFFFARLRVLLLDQSYAYDLIDTVMASEEDRIPVLVKKIQALTSFRTSESYVDLLTGFERVANLASKGADEKQDPSVFQPADKQFFQDIQALEKKCIPLLVAQDYSGILQSLADFRTAVDLFFAEVMIMDSDPTVRGNRLALLQKALKLYSSYGDFHMIVANK